MICSYILRSAAVVHELYVTTTKCFPYRVFNLLTREPGFATELLRLPACVLDPLSKELRSRYPSETLLESHECTVLLKAILFGVDGHTYSTERGHSQNWRTSKTRVCTHIADVGWLSMQQQRSSGPAWAAEVLELQEPAACRKETRGRKRKPKEVGKKRRTGGGGAWRAFCHVQSRGQRLEDIATLAEKYRNLGQSEMSYYRSLGQQGVAARRGGHDAFPAGRRKRSAPEADFSGAHGEIIAVRESFQAVVISRVVSSESSFR